MDFEEELAAVEKTKIRLAMRAARDSVNMMDRAAKNAALTVQVTALPEYRAAHAIMAYVAFGSEADPAGIMSAAAVDTKHVLIPDHFGLIEITGPTVKRVEAEEVDLVLVPGLAFDENGLRLGYGGGWYDRFITKLRPDVKLAGLAYEEQVVQHLPDEPHDLHLHILVTDKRVIRASV
jgi:5-formyltetrahydrofolate cyclo-ligase